MEAVADGDAELDYRAIFASGHTLPPYVAPGEGQGADNLNPPPGKRKSKPAAPSTSDRFQTLNTFIDFTMGSLTRADMETWLILYRDSKQGTARTSQSDIARRGGLSDRAVKRSIKSLVRCGLLKVVHQGGFRKGVSRYRVVPLADDAQGEAYFPS